jgi:hypothetical protein
LLRAGLADEDLGQDEKDLRALVEQPDPAGQWAAVAPGMRTSSFGMAGSCADVHLRVQTIKRDYLDVRESLYRLGSSISQADPAGHSVPPGSGCAPSGSLLAGIRCTRMASDQQQSSYPGSGPSESAGPGLGVPGTSGAGRTRVLPDRAATC